jgi:geranylgeranyl pyrophosphate synthase
MAFAKALEYATRAKSALDAFPPSREREALTALADFVLSRDR